MKASSMVGVFVIAIVMCVSPATAQQFQPAPVQPGVPLELRTPEGDIVIGATEVIKEITAIPAKGIPRSLLAEAEGIAIIPDMLKGGFVVGVRHGRGVVVVKDAQGGWTAPTFISITGGSVGWQVGIQATDLVLVFKTKKSVQGLLTGKFTIGADASAAAGPVGRDATVSTDAALKAEIYSYSRSRGLFAGVALDGSALQVDREAAARYYRPAAPGQPASVPPSTVRLLEEIAQRTAPQAGQVVDAGAPVEIPQPLMLQGQLGESARRLNALLDNQWKAYLALPADVYNGQRVASLEALAPALERFRAVSANPQYRTLSERREFQETFQLLQQLAAQPPQPAITLPPPPSR